MRRITANVFEAFAEVRPEWAESMFDLHFLLHSGAPALQRMAESDAARTSAPAADLVQSCAQELAEAYAAQWGFGAGRSARLVDEVLPACRDFLRVFVAYLQGAPEIARARASGRPSLLHH